VIEIPEPGHFGRLRRFGRNFLEHTTVGRTVKLINSRAVMSDTHILVCATWVVAAWLAHKWDKFAHLSISSPGKRCGKTTLLEVLTEITPRGWFIMGNLTAAAFFRKVDSEMPTLIADECQSLSRLGSESAECVREMMNGSILRNGPKVTRCVGRHHTPKDFRIYCPKIFAMIGEPDSVLADRCFPIEMKRKIKEECIKRYIWRDIASEGKELHDQLSLWAGENEEQISEIYTELEQFNITNDRMADLLLPLQAVLTFEGDPEALRMLKEYAVSLDDRDTEYEKATPDIMLLAACREILEGKYEFVSTQFLLDRLILRIEEPWATWREGEPMSPRSLAALLGKYVIKSKHNRERTLRGYYTHDFKEAWHRYVPKKASNPSFPSVPSRKVSISAQQMS
jgi:hypothetical protein